MSRPVAQETPSKEEANEGGIAARDFECIRLMVYNHCGVDLTGKQVLVSTRLGKSLREGIFSSFAQCCEQLRSDRSGSTMATVIDLLTTNHTSFFREEQHFEMLRTLLASEFPGDAPVSIWSAACSSGEEPYSIAFSLVESLGNASFRKAKILATDISTKVLDRARRGVYAASVVERLPLTIVRRCLLKGTGSRSDQCMVKRDVKSLIDFQRFNLLDDCSSLGSFNIIFCRNVMIYFDKETQERVVNSLAARLLPGGYLFIGHSESLSGINQPLQYILPATYRKQGSSSAKAVSTSNHSRLLPGVAPATSVKKRAS